MSLIAYKYNVGDTLKFKDKFPPSASCGLRGLEGTTAVVEARTNYAGPCYKLQGHDAYFKENCFSCKLKADSCVEAPNASTTASKPKSLVKYMPQAQNATESENEAFWELSNMPGEYMCSNCGDFALHKSDGTEVLSRYCPHCGKAMEVRNED